MFKEKINGGLTFNMPKLSIVTIINLDYMLDKIKANYTINKRENLLLKVKDRLLKL